MACLEAAVVGGCITAAVPSARLASSGASQSRNAMLWTTSRAFNEGQPMFGNFLPARLTAHASPLMRLSAVLSQDAIGSEIGQQPQHEDDDYIVVGLAHCFTKDDNSKLQDCFVIEGIPAGAVECMENGGVTCYKYAWGTTLGVALKQDTSLLPAEFKNARFCDDFDFRTRCAARTWKRSHPQENLLNLIPKGTLRSDFNFNLEDKRILNMENVVNDDDNIKQDMSIDVYGRKGDDESEPDIAKLYNA